jgi:TPR repeat protein
LLKYLLIFLFYFLNIVNATLLEEAKIELKNNNIEQAIELFKKSAREGEDEANFELGKIYYITTYKKKDLDLSFTYFKKAADYEHLKSKYNLAIIYSQKNFKDHSFKKAYELFLALAKQGQPNAQFMVGMYLIEGLGVDKDYDLARKWLEEAYFKNKYEKASCAIAHIYANGLGVLQNLGRARKMSEVYQDKFSLCKKTFMEFKLYKKKYEEDKGFKFGYYK